MARHRQMSGYEKKGRTTKAVRPFGRPRGVAQLVARVVRDDEAAGSSPVTPTRKSPAVKKYSRIFLLIQQGIPTFPLCNRTIN